MNEDIISIKYKNKTKFIETINNIYVVKKQKNDIVNLYDYLELKSFTNLPRIINYNDDEITYEYIADKKIPSDLRNKEFIKTVADLHYKTSFMKDISRKKYKELYEKIINNIDYLKEYYNELIIQIDKRKYFSPSEYLLARNYTIIISNLIYAERELNQWYKLVENKNRERVALIHNNLRREHFLMGEKGYLISFDNLVVDTPVLDLYKLYRTEINNMDFINILKEYNNKFKLTKEEQKLFLLLISIPLKYEKGNSEIENVNKIKEVIDYSYKSKLLVKSKIFKDEIESKTN